MSSRIATREERAENTPMERLSMPEVVFSLPLPVPQLDRGQERSTVEELLRVFESHIAAETESLGEYKRLADATADPVIGMLTKLVLEDEERHHGLLYRMAATLWDDLYWTHSKEALSSGEARINPGLAAQLLARVRQGIREERAGATFLRRLAKDQADLYDGVFALLLETMAMDSEKHERILRFLEIRLKEQVGPV